MTSLLTTGINIDIDVHRAIEARRKSFDQSQNSILREVFGLPSAATKPSPKPPRVGHAGKYTYVLLGDRVEEGTLRDAYRGCLLKIASRDPQFLEQLSRKATRSRRIVARNPKDLYLASPHLSEKFAERLVDHWWIDMNLSRQQCIQRLRIACQVINIGFGNDLILDFPG